MAFHPTSNTTSATYHVAGMPSKLGLWLALGLAAVGLAVAVARERRLLHAQQLHVARRANVIIL